MLSVAALTFGDTVLVAVIGAAVGAIFGGALSFFNTRRIEARKDNERHSEQLFLLSQQITQMCGLGLLELARIRREGRWWPPDAPLPTPGIAAVAWFLNDSELRGSVAPKHARDRAMEALIAVEVVNRRAVIANGSELTDEDIELIDRALKSLLRGTQAWKGSTALLFDVDSPELDDALREAAREVRRESIDAALIEPLPELPRLARFKLSCRGAFSRVFQHSR
jgi:hypothetical protein